MPHLIIIWPAGQAQAGHVLTFHEYLKLNSQTQKALYVGSGSMDDNDWLLPFFIGPFIVEKQPNQGSPQGRNGSR